MNGTSVMTGLSAINVYYSEILLDWAIKFSTAINEIVQTYDDHFSKELNAVKLHKGQQEIAARMRQYIEGSLLTKKTPRRFVFWTM